MKIGKRAFTAVGVAALSGTLFSVTPASAYGEATQCGNWMAFSRYQGPQSGDPAYRDMYVRTCINKRITPSGNEEFSGTVTVFNGSGTTWNYGYNYGRWGSRELIFNKMVGEGLGSQGGKNLVGWYPNNHCFHGEIKKGEYKSCTSGWVKDDSPSTQNRVSVDIMAYAWMLDTYGNKYVSAFMGEIDESPYLN